MILQLYGITIYCTGSRSFLAKRLNLFCLVKIPCNDGTILNCCALFLFLFLNCGLLSPLAILVNLSLHFSASPNYLAFASPAVVFFFFC